jgi:NAD(P)-dependent dehydrogenase (short-subunit alcohol dehydrogenase family)
MDYFRLFDVSDKKALITGAGSGIGQGLSLAFASLGAKVGLLGRTDESLERVAAEITSKGYICLKLKADVTKPEDVRTAVCRFLEEFGRIDILINNAGIGGIGKVEEITEELWDRVMATNVKGPFLCSQEVGKVMKNQGGGKIINIASIASQKASLPGRSPYITSKGAIAQLTKALAVEWAPFNINVNAIAPAYVETPATKSILADPTYRGWVLTKIPLGKIMQPEDIVGAAVFLASQASAMVTGQILYVDGGWTAQ